MTVCSTMTTMGTNLTTGIGLLGTGTIHTITGPIEVLAGAGLVASVVIIPVVKTIGFVSRKAGIK